MGGLVESAVRQGQIVVVIDPEGDHSGLGQLDGVVVLDHRQVITPRTLVELVRDRLSVVVDLSTAVPRQDMPQVAAELGRTARNCRRWIGIPDWIVIDEAHSVLQAPGWTSDWAHGYCLATYQPEALPPLVRDGLLIPITMSPGTPHELPGTSPARTTTHVRHRHKYAECALPDHRGFHFRDDHGATGTIARSVEDFVDHLRTADPAELRHHCAGGDLSRWFRDVYRNPVLAEQISRQEQAVRSGSSPAEEAGRAISDAVRNDYFGPDRRSDAAH